MGVLPPISGHRAGLGEIAGALRRALLPVLAAAALAAAAGFAALSLRGPTYEATTVIEIAPRSGVGEGQGAGTAAVRLHRQAIASHVRALQASDLALRLAAELGLAARPEFNAALRERGSVGDLLEALGLGAPRAGETDEDRVLDAYYRALRVRQLGDRPRIAVEFRSADRRLAANAASRLVELYREGLAVRSVLETLDGTAARSAPVELKVVAVPEPERVSLSPGAGALLAALAALAIGAVAVAGRELLVSRHAIGPADARFSEEPAAGPAPPRLPAEPVHSVPAVARELLARARGRAGFRTLLAGRSAAVDVGLTAVDLARELADQGVQVILVDWSLDGAGFSPGSSVPSRLGITDVLVGRATFEDVIERLPGSQAHVIAAGSSPAAATTARDKDRINMLLDALDDAYEHVLIAGEQRAVRDLFTTIEGRIDAGVEVAAPEGAPPAGFLGFDVADLHVIRYEPVVQHRGRVGAARTAVP